MSPRPASSVPTHLGLILDGNRRWARAQGLPLMQGHRQGYENLHQITLAAFDRGVQFVSAYVFSTENWNRAQEEVDYLMDLFVWVATKEIDKYDHEGLKLAFVGSRRGLSPRVLKALASAEERTRNNQRGTVVLCFNYGGKTELAEGVARLVADGIKPEDVTEDKLAEYLYEPAVPPVDFIIRTSGEQRLSNFMLWRAAYAELYFTPVHWPAFTKQDLDAALDEYAARGRRFGH
jgi:undecaprenyl diphosphate synthase